MCGLFGWCIKDDAPGDVVIRLASVLPLLNETRGDHAHGAAWAANDGTIHYNKVLGEAHNSAAMFMKSRLMLGHTRYATVGDKEKAKNAHPFAYKHIVGAHNGSVTNWRQAANKWKVTAEVDSELLFYRLAERGHFKSLTGWGVASWFDTRKPDRVYLTRLSSSGDLAVALTDYGVVWSSDESHLATALETAGLKVVAAYSELPVNKLHWAERTSLYVDKSKHMKFGSETPYSARRTGWSMRDEHDWDMYEMGMMGYRGNSNDRPYPYSMSARPTPPMNRNDTSNYNLEEYLRERRKAETQKALGLKAADMNVVQESLRQRSEITGNVSRLVPSATPPGAVKPRKDFQSMTDEEWKAYCAAEIDGVFGKE